MKEQEQSIVKPFPASLKPQDRLLLEMAIADDDEEEASRLVRDYGIEIPNGLAPLGLCQDWLAGLKKTEKHHCQNIVDLHSQGKSIGGMQAAAGFMRKGVEL
jgi:hypothetical protein